MIDDIVNLTEKQIYWTMGMVFLIMDILNLEWKNIPLLKYKFD